MASVYQKVNAICEHTLLSYDNYSQIQICYDNTGKSFNLYTAYPDAEEGSRFIRDMFLEISKSDISKLSQCIKKVIQQNEDNKIVTEVSKTTKQRLVIESHHTFKNLILGYQKRTTPLRLKPIKFNENSSVSSKRRSTSSESVQWGEFERFRNFNFRKVYRFDIIYCNLNDYVEEIHRMEQKNLENQAS